jgi:ABC-type polysaccharide/polyol phosphate transport system ATPase subunit
MKHLAVRLTDVSKEFVVHHERPTLTENILNRGFHESFWALKKINLTIGTGEKVGIIGPNGSGKTTVLKIINKITTPTTGTVETWGKVVSLIDLEAGFHPDLTGEENVMLNGMLVGMSRSELRSKLRRIIRFAGIGTFIDAPLYTYSDGMKLRLGFSIAVHTNPEILVLDEALAVGDQDFHRKSFAKIQEFFRLGKTIILVSHNLSFIQKYCTRVVWLERGEIVRDGKPRPLISRYQKTQKQQ